MTARAAPEQDTDWIARLLVQRWGSTTIVAHGEAFDLLSLPALVAEPQRGLAIYRLRDDDAELMSLGAVSPGQGVGTF